MSTVAAFLVVMDEHCHPEQGELTIAAVRQLRGVASVRTLYDDVGHEIRESQRLIRDVRAGCLTAPVGG